MQTKNEKFDARLGVCALLFSFLMGVSSHVAARDLDLAVCKRVIEWAAEEFPIRTGRSTTMNSVNCMKEIPEGIRMQYSYIFDEETGGSFPIQRVKQIQTNVWCTNPKSRSLLESVTMIEQTYVDPSGVFLGEILISKEDCI
jgi:hypothetical protein